MVALRSGRRDRWLLAPVWGLTLVVLGLGIALVAPILIVWGTFGLLGAGFATWVLLRDIRAASGGAAGDAPSAGGPTPGTTTPGTTTPGTTTSGDAADEPVTHEERSR